MKRRLTKRLLKTTALFSGTESLAMLCGIVRAKVVALAVGASGVGMLGILSLVCEMAGSFVSSGLKTSGVRVIASASPGESARTVHAVRHLALISGLCAAALVLFLSPLLSSVSFGFMALWPLFAFVAVAVIFNSVSGGESAVLQGSGRLRSLASASSLSALLALVPACIIVWNLRNMWGVALIVVVTSVVSAIVFYVKGRRAVPEKYRKGEGSNYAYGTLLKISAAMTLSGFLSVAAGYAVVTFIGFGGGLDSVGLYQAGYQMSVRYVGVIFSAMAMEYFPRISAQSSHPRRVELMMRHECMVFLPLAAIGASAFIFLSPWLVRLLYDGSFLLVVPMLVCAAPSFVARVLSWNMAFVILAKGSPRQFMLTESVGALIMAVCVIAGYSLWGLPGAGVGITLDSVLYCALVAGVNRRLFGIRASSRVWIAAGLFFLLVAGVSLLSQGSWG